MQLISSPRRTKEESRDLGGRAGDDINRRTVSALQAAHDPRHDRSLAVVVVRSVVWVRRLSSRRCSADSASRRLWGDRREVPSVFVFVVLAAASVVAS